ncbi:DUF3515 domain-containing protein [Streptomyces sedi]|uniref:DUF3515 domain-containing protein n=1 Tax=Streptomyces sedi TaxID=555059 RepID=A0A5C4UUX6_9ACTN|nr:DUF3515 domain-containing protein [Streptomyces sedi]TNM27295.1 DUF3515 domain-containing protein [Streptomyces sedi]
MTARPPAAAVRRALPPAALVLLLAACSPGSGAADVRVPEPGGEAAAACRALAEDLPDVVDGQERRELDEPSPYAAVWGEPGIVLRCGVEAPAELTPGTPEYEAAHADVVGVNEVSWLLEEESGAKRFTTTEREVLVEMTVPDSYAPEVNPLLDVAAPIDRHIPLSELYRQDDPDDPEEPDDAHEGHDGDGHHH